MSLFPLSGGVEIAPQHVCSKISPLHRTRAWDPANPSLPITLNLNSVPETIDNHSVMARSRRPAL